MSEPNIVSLKKRLAESPQIYQCVPNFSEGQRPLVVEALADSVRNVSGAVLADCSRDPDHNRCVLSILGSGSAVKEAVLASARVAVREIDLRQHTGQHPRIGALDVLPIVPLRSASRAEAEALARSLGEELSSELALPVYFYEQNALPGRASALPELRRGGFERLAAHPLSGTLAPDLGPERVHPTAGAVVVGARGPLVAYNINLNTADVRIAEHIARRLRRERDTTPALTGVRALGLFLAKQNRAQVSLNLTQPDKTDLPSVYSWVCDRAAEWGVQGGESEVIGLIPHRALGGDSPETIHWRGYQETQILDFWLADRPETL
jgi:glutamate formiminotransferase